MKLFSKKKFKRGGYVGTPTMGTPIPIPLMNSSPIQGDREAQTRLAEFLCYMSEGETITEHETDCPLDDCKMRDHFTEDAQRIIRFITTGEHS